MQRIRNVFLTLGILTAFTGALQAQEKYGNALNAGLGIGGYSGYYGNANQTMPVLHLDYEFDVAKNFTLAPFVNVYSYSGKFYYNSNNTGYRYYNYRETVIPIGVKGAYYFDSFLKASSKWDFYLGGSLGFAIRNARWDSDYNGDKFVHSNATNLFLDLHVGAEYHFNAKIGAFLDLSNGVSTVGLAFHSIK